MAHGRFWRQSVQGVCHILWYLLQKLGVWWCVVVTSWASAKDPRFSALTLGILPDRLEVSAGSSNWALIQAEGSCPRERLLELGGDRRTNGFAENITNSTTPMDDSNWVHVYFPSDVRGKSAPLPAVGRRWGLIAPARSRTGKTSQTSETSGPVNDDQTSGSRIGGADRVAALGENGLSTGKESQKLPLTVRARLDPDDFSLDDERYRAELQSHTMEPVLTIAFHKNEEGEKLLKTTLSVTYCLDANVKELGDPTRFGWFHDNLQVSFKCLGGPAVTIESRNEYLGGEARPFQNAREQKQSTTETKASAGTLKAAVGYDGARVEGALTRKQQKTDNTGETQQMTSSTDRWFVKNTSFAIIPQGGSVELACAAHLTDDLDVMDPSARSSTFNSGRISKVDVRAEGEWKITDNENSTESEWCPYQFTGRRTLHKVEQNEKVIRNPHFPWNKRTIREREERNVTQTVDKILMIDHSFSNVENLRRKTPYDWHLGSHPEAPAKVGGVMRIAPVPMSSSNPSLAPIPSTYMVY